MKINLNYLLILPVFYLFGCGDKKAAFDASGIFEAEEIIISAEANGQLVELLLNEGEELNLNQVVGKIDCTDIALQKAQLEASIEALRMKRGDATPEISIVKQQIESQNAQIETLRTQLRVVTRERDRIKKLVNQEAVPVQQLDDLQGKVDVLQKQIEAAEKQIMVLQQQMESQKDLVAIRNRGIMSEQKPLNTNIERMDNQLSNCEIVNPMSGTVLAQYVEQYEFVNMGKPLYKIANLKDMVLRAYLTEDQLSDLKLGQEVTVLVDKNSEEYQRYPGRISWIADEAEFTPKTIQTKDERANLVYAVKIKVENDGFIRVGMYGEVQI